MRIKQLELFNFRQFKDENIITFSTDERKKVTFVLADNTTGKTTLIEAFRFLFLGATNYKDEIINRTVANEAVVGSNIDVKVSANVEYKDRVYNIVRKIEYKKGESNKLSQIYNLVKITYKDLDGITKTINEANANEFLKEMMPKDLFDYFFFEGESIKRLGNDLFTKGKNQNAFADAIKALLGITYLYKMRDDLQKTVKKFNDDLEGALDSDKENQERQKEINQNLEEIEKIKSTIKEKEKELEHLKEEKERVNEILLENASTKDKQNERRKTESELSKLKQQIKSIKQKMFNDFSKNGWYLFASKLQEKAIETLKSESEIDKGIPGLDASCIKHIIKHHKCICGAEIIEGSSAYERLKELENFIPPVSIGTQIREFKSKFTDINRLRNSAYDSVKDGKVNYNALMIEYEKKEKEIDKLDAMLKGAKDMSSFVEDQRNIDNNIDSINIEIGSLNERKLMCENLVNKKEKEKTITNSNDRVNFINKCLYYNKRSYNAVESYIDKHETKMKQALQNKINEVFKEVFNVGYTIELKDDYSLEIELDENSIGRGDMMSGAQDTITAFAFIGAVIDLSKQQISQNDKSNEDNGGFESTSEPYPLVLDAPSAAFDVKRIKDFCKFIPELAEQTIIFIKDTDGKYVEAELNSKIGKKYELVKINDWETKIKEK